MAQERPSTPEKQLLKLIEDPKGENGALVKEQSIKHSRRALFSLSAWGSRFSFFKGRASSRWFCGRGEPGFDIKMVNCALLLVSALLIAAFIANTYFSMRNINTMPRLKVAFKDTAAQATETPVSLSFQKASSVYLEKIRDRDIFRMGPKKMADAKGTIVNLPSDRIIEATQHLKLVGISWSNDPDAMIEDTKAKRTFFVKRGNMIGEVKVNAIFKDKVVLSFGGEEIELK